ncbi:MAG: ATP-binding protein [Anaerolineae bacterium]|nr:ATP-binding protein [Anaerolineae bacterium]
MQEELTHLLNNAEQISVLGSPSSTSEIDLDILGNAVEKKLVGELALFNFIQGGKRHYALGQITEILLRNVWHEDPTMRSLIRQKGRIDAVSERQDTHQGKMTISAVFSEEKNGGNYQPSLLGTVPATGTPIYLASDNVLRQLLKNYQQEIFYLGKVFGSQPLLPLWFKHFDSGKQGAGEAYHIGIFGKTGSGKSVLAKMMLLAYAKHPEMNIIIIDPQGEFAKNANNSGYPNNMGEVFNREILSTLNRTVQIFNIDTIQLDRWELFGELLIEFGFFFDLGIKKAEYQKETADSLIDHLKDSPKVKLDDLSANLKVALEFIHSNIHRIYANQAGIERIQYFVNEVNDKLDSEERHPLIEKWRNVTTFFSKSQTRKSPWSILSLALRHTQNSQYPIVIIDLSSNKPENIKRSKWDEVIKPILIDSFLDALIRQAEQNYQQNESLNTLVVIDEAHRLAPQGSLDNERTRKIRTNLIDAARTTRKYGLGWLFLSQTLSSLHTDIVNQLRISFFGFGLSMGSEFQKIRELIGDQKESIKLYQRFRDPHSAFDVNMKEYSFMTIGPVSPLSFSGTPLFFNAFNNLDEFALNNNLGSKNH